MDCQISESRYEEALQWLFSQLPMFSRVGAPAYKPGLETTERLDSIYHHPHRKFKAIHVAGTNGKGSTSHMIASVLQTHGFKTALYTSPHLTDFRERMRINGRKIPKEEVVKFVDDWKKRREELNPSFFELTMMMAFDWFARENVDYAVIEVGMGGRLDSTNVITPLLSVITNISFDHTQFLGNTLEAIAGEKAGIIKHGVPVVIGRAEGSVRDLFVQKAREQDAPIFFADEYDGLKTLKRARNGFWEGRLGDGIEFAVPLPGEYQKENIRTVLCALDVLKSFGVVLSNKDIVNGLRNVVLNTGLRGRWQTLRENPTVVCDTGHNIGGISENLKTLAALYPDRKVRFVIGFVNDKDVSHIVDLFPKDGEYYFTRASIPRAMPETELASIFEECGISGRKFCTVAHAFKTALEEAAPADIIYVGGSTFIVTDLLSENLEIL